MHLARRPIFFCLFSFALAVAADAVAVQAPGEALVKAAAKGDLAAVNTMLAQGGDVNAPDKNGNTALMEAARTGKDDVVKALIAAKADLNAQNKDGWTPAMRAIFAAQASTLKTLLDAGAKIDVANNKGERALDVALQYTGNVRPELFPLLAKAGADVKGATVKGEPALIHALSSDQDGLVAGLLRAGADPNVKDAKGRPAIVLAARNGYLASGVKCVTLLISAGVDVNARDERNRSALENAVDLPKMRYAKEAERKNAGVVVYALASRGADFASIAAARGIVAKNTYILFDTMIMEGQKKAASLATERSSPAAPAGKAPAAARPSGPPPKGCPAATSVTKLASPSDSFKAAQPIAIETINSAKAIVEKNGSSVRVFLTNRNFTATAMNSSMVTPVKGPGDVIVKIRLMNGSTPVGPGEYTPAAGWGNPLSVSAELVVSSGKGPGAEITMVPAQSADTGKATVTAFGGGYVCGSFSLKGSLGEVAGHFVAAIEK